MAPRVSLPTPKNENGVEWLRGEGFTLSVLTQHADRVADTHTHTHMQPTPCQLEGFLPRLMLLPHSSLAQCRLHTSTHTNKQCRQCTVFSLYILSHCHCRTHMHCVFVCVCESMSYISFIMCVCVCMCHGGLLYLWRAFR